jgi:hypothetical protein
LARHGTSLFQKTTELLNADFGARPVGLLSVTSLDLQETTSRKSIQLLLDVLPLPTSIWVNLVLPFFADRLSFNDLASASKEIHNVTQQLLAAKKTTPLWPKTSIRVGSGAFFSDLFTGWRIACKWLSRLESPNLECPNFELC